MTLAIAKLSEQLPVPLSTTILLGFIFNFYII